MIPTLTRAFEASAAIGAYKAVRFSDVSATSRIATASANTDPVVGVSGSLATVVGELADVTMAGIGQVTAGGTITAGALLTVDASGNAIVATPTAGVFMAVIGRALEPAVAGDVFQVLVNPVAFYRGT